MIISIKKALSIASNQLKNIATDSKKEALILLSFLLKKEIVYLFLHENDDLINEKKYFKLIKRRKEGEPIEYITKRVSFYSEEFFIDKGALIPRPETELLIDEVLKVVKKLDEGLTIAEIGTGSGIISIILAKKLKKAKIIATDISFDATKIAKRNIDQFNLLNRIKVINRPYLNGVEEKTDIIVSNPPYVANNFKVAKSLYYEPKKAIFGGNQGYEILRDIIRLAKKTGVKYLFCEIGFDQKIYIDQILKDNGFTDFYFYKDLSGFDRGFVAKGVNNV